MNLKLKLNFQIYLYDLFEKFSIILIFVLLAQACDNRGDLTHWMA